MTDSERATMTSYQWLTVTFVLTQTDFNEVIRHFLFAWDFPTGSEILGVLGKMTPRK